MVEVKNVYKSFGEKVVLRNVNAKFVRGKVNLIIGKSGSGKTVLLKSIVGLHEIDKGEILYDGRIFSGTKTKYKKQIRKEIGMVFQGGALFDSLTILENVIFPLDMFTQMSYEEKKQRAVYCLERVNLKDVEKLYPSEISGGMAKRVAIARAIAINPRYLFFDEPNSGLDPISARLIDELIAELTKEFNAVTIVNTHDINSVFNIGDNIVFIHNQTNWWTGSKEEIKNSGNKELLDFIKSSVFTIK